MDVYSSSYGKKRSSLLALEIKVNESFSAKMSSKWSNLFTGTIELHCRSTFRQQHQRSDFALSGVPQGSVLAPLLFSVYAHALSSFIKRGSCLFYADDSQLQYSFTVGEVREISAKIKEDSKLLLVLPRVVDPSRRGNSFLAVEIVLPSGAVSSVPQILNWMM